MRVGRLGDGEGYAARLVAAAWAGDRLFTLSASGTLSAWTAEGTLSWSTNEGHGLALTARDASIWVASMRRVARYDLDGRLHAQHERVATTSALVLSPDGASLLQLTNDDTATGVLLDSVSLAPRRKRPLFRDPGRQKGWTCGFESGGQYWLGSGLAYRRFDWSTRELGRELMHPFSVELPVALPPTHPVTYAHERSMGAGPGYLVHRTITPIPRGDGHVAFVWTQRAIESEDFADRAWAPRPFAIQALEVPLVGAVAFLTDPRALVLGHHRAIHVHATETGELLAHAAVDGLPSLVVPLPANQLLVGTSDGAAWIVEPTALPTGT